MSFSFEFDAPKSYNFLLEKSTLQASIETDLTNINDYWFMIQHEDEDAYAQSIQQSQIGEEAQQSIKRVITEEKEHQIQKFFAEQEKRQSIRRVDSKISQEQVQEKKDTLVQLKPFPQKKQTKKAGKKTTKRINYHKELQKKKQQPKIQKNPKGVVTRSKSRILANHKKSISKTPCPFPARIQRQWQSINKKAWYSLQSIEQRRNAQKSMKKMIANKQQQQKKWQNRSLDNKKVRFRF